MEDESVHATADARAEAARARRVELFSVLLIALTAVLTAWSTFQASKWGGVMSIEFSSANAARTESVRLDTVANQKTQVDISIFVEYVNAAADEDDQLQEFYVERMPARLETALEAWSATDPLQNPDAPASPFDMDEYRVAEKTEAQEFRTAADEAAQAARDANQTGDDYTVTTIFAATVLLLSALSTKVAQRRLQMAMLFGASVLFIGTVAVIATYPIEI